MYEDDIDDHGEVGAVQSLQFFKMVESRPEMKTPGSH